MAGSRYVITPSAAIAVGTGATVTLLALTAPTLQQIRIIQCSIDGEGNAVNLDRALVKLALATGTLSGTTVTPAPLDSNLHAARTAALHTVTGDSIDTLLYSNLYDPAGTWARGPGVILNPGEKFIMELTNNYSSSIDFTPTIIIEE